jgi:hypothetical protein
VLADNASVQMSATIPVSEFNVMGKSAFEARFGAELILALGINPAQLRVKNATIVNGVVMVDFDLIGPERFLQPDGTIVQDSVNNSTTVESSAALYARMSAMLKDSESPLNKGQFTASSGVIRLCPDGTYRSTCESDESDFMWLGVMLVAAFVLLGTLVVCGTVMRKIMRKKQMDANAFKAEEKNGSLTPTAATLADGLQPVSASPVSAVAQSADGPVALQVAPVSLPFIHSGDIPRTMGQSSYAYSNARMPNRLLSGSQVIPSSAPKGLAATPSSAGLPPSVDYYAPPASLDSMFVSRPQAAAGGAGSGSNGQWTNNNSNSNSRSNHFESSNVTETTTTTTTTTG